MKVDEEEKFGDTLILECTGRRIYANRAIIGINNLMELFEGYDGSIYDMELTKEERIELADYMIDLWKQYKNKI